MTEPEQESPLEHIVQHPLIERPAKVGPLTPDGKITIFSDQIAMLALAGILLIALVPMMVRRRRGRTGVDALVPSGSANMLEAVCDYLRKEVAEPALHEHTDRFIKYIWSVFFFVLTVNILGLLPIPAISNLFGTHLGGSLIAQIAILLQRLFNDLCQLRGDLWIEADGSRRGAVQDGVENRARSCAAKRHGARNHLVEEGTEGK